VHTLKNVDLSEKYNLDVHFIRNYKHKLGGRYGCFDSHIQCLRDVKKNKIDVCLIFEDDIVLDKNCIERINVCLYFIKHNEKVKIINSIKWDLIYIDGNHDYDVVKQDFENCSKNLNVGGFIILDDSALYTNYIPPFYSTAGHPGPSKLASEINLNEFEEFISVGHNRIFRKVV
jgi:hypothetical protein